MDSAFLLVIDHSPECAEEINSLLRNSGIIIRTGFAQSAAEAEEIITSTQPFLIVYNASAPKKAPVTKILQLAERHKLQAAIRFAPDEPGILTEALTFHSCLAINNEDDAQLVKAVTSILEHRKTESEFNNLKIKLDELQSRYNLLLDSSHESIAYIHEGLHIYANRAYLELLNVEDFNDIEAVSLLEIMSSDQIDLKKLLRDMNKGKYPSRPTKVEIDNPSGSNIEVELVFSAARYDGENCIQMMVQEPDANAALKEELYRLRRTDPVTQLANRKTFSGRLGKFIEDLKDDNLHSAVYYLEADDVQKLHEQLGLSGWDEFMANMADVIRRNMENDDIAARFNDSGFAILATRLDRSSLHSMGDAIITDISNQVTEIGDHSLTATCSIGMALMGSLTRDADEVVKQARSAFSQALQTGNCMARYRPKTAVDATDEQDPEWVERIRFALNNQDFYSVQHSIVNLEGDTEGLFESITFMRDEKGDLPNEQFMPIAERNDLGAMIDRNIISGLMKAIAGTGDRHIINLSTNSLLDFSFSSWFRHQLEELNVLGSQIILQLSAPAVEPNIKSATRLIDELKSTKCSFSLSSFDDRRRICALLDQLDVSLLKLRPGLTDGLTNNSAHQDIVRNVVHAADGKQISVIADEIKDAADLAVLWQCGVKLVAGDFLKEPPQVIGQ